MLDTKVCELCEQPYARPPKYDQARWLRVSRFCSRECKDAAQQGQSRGGQRIPCRICGQPTKHGDSRDNPKRERVRCERPECIEASRTIKNERIAARAREMYANGTRKAVGSWRTVDLISREERSLIPWFAELGWASQHKVNTGVHTNTLPRQFRLDFALPAALLYVEVDGHVHRLRKERDERRDTMLGELGWQGMRIAAHLVRDNPDHAKALIRLWIDAHLAPYTPDGSI